MGCELATLEYEIKKIKKSLGHNTKVHIKKTEVLLNSLKKQNPEELLFRLLFK